MKKILSQWLVYLMAGLFIIGLLLLIGGLGGRHYRNIEFNEYKLLFILGGVILTAPFVLYLYLSSAAAKREENNAIHQLKTNGVKLPVNLGEIKIAKSRKSYFTRVVNNAPKTGALNQFTGNSDKNRKTTTYNLNEIHFKVPYGNNFIKFKRTIDMEPKKLLLHFAVQKETHLYVNPKNIKEYYLDLEFLTQ